MGAIVENIWAHGGFLNLDPKTDASTISGGLLISLKGASRIFGELSRSGMNTE
jgi:hypothetical protein